MKRIIYPLILCSILLTFASCSGARNASISSQESVIESSSSNGKLIVTAKKDSLMVGEHTTLSYKSVNTLANDIAFRSMSEEIASVTSSGEVVGLQEGNVKIEAYSVSNPFLNSFINLTISEGKPEEDFTYYDFDMYKNRRHSLKATGTQNVLVIPVEVKDFEANATQENLNRIKEVFNAEENSKWESVRSFYEKSSYGQLDLNFIVADEWYKSNLNPTDINKLALKDDGGACRVVEYAASWFKEKYHPSAEAIDQNNDGFIDGIWVIYSAPTFTKYDYSVNYPYLDSSTFWAFTVDSYVNLQDAGNIGNPLPKVFSWGSFDFIDEFDEEGTLDAHTYIHETGHMLGLNDYYCTYGNTYASPLGCVDMMDNNIGDHCAFSKFALGWIKPRVIKESTTIDITPYEESGDFLVLANDDYNGTAFDEYFTIEYVTPTGLNQADYTKPYVYNSLQGYSEPGIRILHIDNRPVNRLAKFESNPKEFINDPISNTDYPAMTVYYDKNNTRPMYQATLMQNNFLTGKENVYSTKRKYYEALRNNKMDADDALFHEGDTFDLEETSPYCGEMPSRSNRLDKYAQSQNQNDTFNFQIYVKEITSEKATLEISVVE